MKLKQLLTKTLLAAVLLGVGANAWATDVPYSIGSEGCGYRAEYSDPYTVKNGETLHITFTNNNYGTSTAWNNYMIEATSAVDKHDGVYFDLRGDNYAFGAGTFVQNYNGNCTSDLNGATVDNYITYAGGVITVNQIFTKAEVTTYNRVYTYTVAGSPKSVIIYITEEAAQVTITNVETSKWSTVWATDFSSAPSGITYSLSGSGTNNINNGYLFYKDSDMKGRNSTLSFTDAAFNVDTDWIMEFDWNCGRSNSNSSNVTFATNSGNAFTFTWGKLNTDLYVTVTDAAAEPNTLSTTVPTQGYNIGSISTWNHVVVKGDKDNGIYLTITNGGTTYVNNILVADTYGYPVSFNGALGKGVSAMGVDNISFKTPTVAGFVATPTSEITGASGTSRKFTLSCLTDGATIYYATSDLEKGAAGWTEYTTEVTTDATTIYAYAEDDEDNTSDKMNFATGTGTTIDLLPATVTHSNNGVYTIASNQAAILGSPTATIHYQIDGGSEQTSTNASVNVNIAADGTLTYWLTADGYGATDPADATVYAAVGYAVTRTIDFCTSNSNEWAVKGDGTTVTGDTHTYYIYKDQSSTAVADDILATTFINDASSWRIQRFYGGTSPYNNTEYIALKNLAAGQIVQFACSSAPSIVANLTAVPATTYTGTYTYTATTAGDVIVSLGKGVVITKIKLCETTVPVTISAVDYGTFASDYDLDFTSLSSTLKAYKATVSGSTITFTAVTTVPAGEGVLLKSVADLDEPTVFNIPVTTGVSAWDADYNAFVRGTGVAVATGTGPYNYVLSTKSGVVGFYQAADQTVPADKCYLQSTTNATRIAFDFDDETTGISEELIVNSEKFATASVYDLQGRKVVTPTKGLYIVNGKKVIVK